MLGDAILDGRNRCIAACDLGMPYPVRQYEGDDPLSYVISLNLARQHLNEGQRASVAATLANLAQGRPAAEKPANLQVFSGGALSDASGEPKPAPVFQARAARMLNVSERSVASAHKVHEHGAPELITTLQAGEVAASTAADIAELTKKEQAELVAAGKPVMRAPREGAPRGAGEGRARRKKQAALIGVADHLLPRVDLEHVLLPGSPVRDLTCLEPACGRGHTAMALREYFGAVTVSDVHPYGFGAVEDILTSSHPPGAFDWVITNLLLRLAQALVLRALPIARRGVAMLARTAFLESVGRYEGMFAPQPSSQAAQFTRRAPMVKGRLDRKASTATGYAWLVREKDWSRPTRPLWIPPCRRGLERDSDYAAVAGGSGLETDKAGQPERTRLL